MAKMTKGVLARDTDDRGLVAFFPGLTRNEVCFYPFTGEWDVPVGGKYREAIHDWVPEEWKEQYDMPLPRKGRAFEAEIEL